MHALLLAPNHRITIKDLVQGLAAHKSGQLQQGDVLVSVDGRSVESYDLDQVFSVADAA